MDRALNSSACAFTDFLVTVEDEAAGRARPASIFYTPVYSLKHSIIGTVSRLISFNLYWHTRPDIYMTGTHPSII